MVLPLLCALIYLLLSMRFLVDVRVEIDKARQGVRIGLRMWGMRLSLDMPLRMPEVSKGSRAQVQKVKRAWPFAKAIIQAIRWGQTDVRLCIGTGDAALTAMMAGMVGSLGSSLQAVAGQRFPFDIQAYPVFNGLCFELKSRCIFSLVPGDIMFAVARAAVRTMQKEGFSWRSIPLKA